MPIKDIMVVCDAGVANDFRVETSLHFAKVFDAHITGIHLTPYPIPEKNSSGFNKVIDYLATDRIKLSKNTAELIKVKFETKASELDIPCEWKCIDGIDLQFIIDNARYADFVVLPQGYSRFGEEDSQRIDDYLSIYMGRPTIVVPDIKKVFNLPKRIMIAWDESREAARAVHDAMPFLEYAEDVQIVSVSNKPEEQNANIIYSDDLRKHLSHHGVNAEAMDADELADGTGKTILHSALEFDADLIVMGAYGVTRFKEVILGGVTRFLLKHTTIPLLLSH
ncbi:MAG: universal stress protein [Gammaproteobacteria bacterium]